MKLNYGTLRKKGKELTYISDDVDGVEVHLIYVKRSEEWIIEIDQGHFGMEYRDEAYGNRAIALEDFDDIVMVVDKFLGKTAARMVELDDIENEIERYLDLTTS